MSPGPERPSPGEGVPESHEPSCSPSASASSASCSHCPASLMYECCCSPVHVVALKRASMAWARRCLARSRGGSLDISDNEIPPDIWTNTKGGLSRFFKASLKADASSPYWAIASRRPGQGPKFVTGLNLVFLWTFSMRQARILAHGVSNRISAAC